MNECVSGEIFEMLIDVSCRLCVCAMKLVWYVMCGEMCVCLGRYDVSCAALDAAHV
jgi:hypothetical protein